ncbi:MIZ/SP-RING zinc finger protein [Phlyctema vagabunda]|uniref:MIZ/SP-RING zinc finger protein n=1 Tax=Phlyctema vagabunda TaxID=108571 RepID=A0ABR4PHV1_9HELO
MWRREEGEEKTKKLTKYSRQVAAVLPSPAPSDEPSPVMSYPHESPTIISSSPETHRSTSPAHNRFSAMHGEPSRPRTESLQSTVVENSSSTSAHHAPSLQEGQPRPLQELRKEIHSHPTSAHRPSPVAPPLPLPSTLLPNQPSTQSPIAVYHQGQATQNATNILPEMDDERGRQRLRNQIPAPHFLRNSIFIVDAKLQELGPAATHPDNLEKPRLELLKSACIKEDIVYVALHQIFCIWSFRRANFPSIPGLPADTVLGSAFKIIGSFLRTNDAIAIHHLKWFTEFPCPIEDLPQTLPAYGQALVHVGTLLSKLVSAFQILEKECSKRGYPPLVNEMVDRLGLCSSILQDVIYRYIRRNIGYGEDDLGLQIESVFEKDIAGHLRLAARCNTDRPPSQNEVQQHLTEIANQYSVLNQERLQRKRSIMQYVSQTPSGNLQASAGPGTLRSSGFGPAVQTSNASNWQGQSQQIRQSPSSAGSPNIANLSMNSPMVTGQPSHNMGSPVVVQQVSSPHPISPAHGEFQWPPLILRSNSGRDSQYMSRQIPQQPRDPRNSMTTQAQLQMPSQQQIPSQQMHRQHSSTYQRQTIDEPQDQHVFLQQQMFSQRQALEDQQAQYQAQQQAAQEQQIRMQQQIISQRQNAAQQSQQLTVDQQRMLNQQIWLQQIQSRPPELLRQQNSAQIQQDQNLQHALAMNRTRASQINHGQLPVLSAPTTQASRNNSISSNSASPMVSRGPQIGSNQVQPPYNPYMSIRPINDPSTYASTNPLERPLVPPLNYNHPSYYPQPELETLHQAHLRSPELLPARLPSHTKDQSSVNRLYQAMLEFKCGPVKLPSDITMSNFEFSLLEADTAFIARDNIVGTEVQRSVSRELCDGTLQYRLRCIKTKPTVTECQTADWVVSDTVWPATAFLEINGQSLQIRRKAYHGKDLPIDITRHVASLGVGPHRIKVVVPRSRRMMQDVSYFFAVEVVEVIKHSRIMKRCLQSQLIPSANTVQSIQKALTATAIDDELTMVGADLTINLADPFTAQIFEIPVRGISCLHRECFDLETFLVTRNGKLKAPQQPCMVDVWKCPLCSCDARPWSLQVDEFLMSVRARLMDEKNLDVKAILVSSDGTWKPKPEPEPITRKRKSGNRVGTSSDSEDDSPFRPRKKVTLEKAAPEVIELDSD